MLILCSSNYAPTLSLYSVIKVLKNTQILFSLVARKGFPASPIFVAGTLYLEPVFQIQIDYIRIRIQIQTLVSDTKNRGGGNSAGKNFNISDQKCISSQACRPFWIQPRHGALWQRQKYEK